MTFPREQIPGLIARLRGAIDDRFRTAAQALRPSDAVPISVWEDGFTKVRQALELEVANGAIFARYVLSLHGTHGADYACAGCGELVPCGTLRQLVLWWLGPDGLKESHGGRSDSV